MEQTQGPPTLYLLCGLAFAGKSTLARALAAWVGSRALLVATDAINSERGVGLDGAAISPVEWDITYAEVYQRVEAGLRAGRDVILDDVNFLRAQRDYARAIAARAGARVAVILAATTEAVARERLERNRRTGERYDVRDEDFALVASRFEPPTAEEGALVYDGVEAPDAWLRRMAGALRGQRMP